MRFLNIGTEAIAFQSPEFADKMVSLMDKILEERTGKAADDSKAGKDLIKLVKETTGMNVDIIFNTEYPPCTLPFHVNPDSILGHSSLKEFYAEDGAKTLKRIKEVKTTSTIDLKNAKVSGIFSVNQTPIYMGFDSLRFFKLNAREVVAILAHEIGHCFVAYEMAFRTVRTNQILSAIAKEHGSGDKDKFNYILKTTEEIYNLKTGVLQTEVDNKSRDVVLTVTLGRIEEDRYNQSLMGNTSYDITTFEALADNFSTRLGLGRELVSGLEKLFKSYGAAEFSLSARVVLTIFDIATVVSLVGLTIVTLSGGIGAGIFLILNVLTIWSRLDGRDHNNVYDKLSIRLKRVKEQIVQYLKDNKLPAKDVKNALSSIANIDKTISEISEYKGFLPAILNLIDPASIKVNNAINIQQKLESVAANDLYIKASQLRVLD